MEDSVYCHRCGRAQLAEAQSRGFNWWWLLLIFLGPLGWVALICILLASAVGGMKPTTRLAIGGFIFPPLWAPLIWALRMPRWAKLAVIAGLVAANTFWLHHLTGGWTAAMAALAVTVILGIIWLTRANPAPSPAEERYLAGIRREIDDDLDACHDLIAEIEEQLKLSPLATSPALQRRYTHALEVRGEAAELLRAAKTEEDLVVADRRVSRALNALDGVRDDLAGMLPGPTQK